MVSLPKWPRIRHRLETESATEADKDALGRRLDRVRHLLNPSGARTIDNSTLLNAMCDIAFTSARADHGIPQTREVACTKVVLPQVIARA